MVEVRIEFDDEEQYERLKALKKHRGLTWKSFPRPRRRQRNSLKKHRGLTWKGLLLEGEKKVREDTPE